MCHIAGIHSDFSGRARRDEFPRRDFSGRARRGEFPRRRKISPR